MDHQIPDKTNKVLNIILLGFLLILVRVWYLSVIQHEENLERARKPRRRSVIEHVERASIRDRFNIPLALNKIQYNAAVCYADIRQIPSTAWEVDESGKRVRIQKRLNYISQLSQMLSSELGVDAQLIEDTIHGKASLFPHTPFVIKENLSEQEYYRLKGMEKEWAGVRAQQGSERHYPLGKVGCDVIGYMGAISSREYQAIAQELAVLKAYLNARESGDSPILPVGFNNPLEVRERVRTLQEKSYTIHDLTGKTGVEASFDAELRGYAGKTLYEVNTKGNILRELPGGRPSVTGQRLTLSISSELQQFAEELLIANESIREARYPNGEPDLSVPWIKGGAIVALDPKTGEVLALASYPRIDPNDFIPSGDSATKTHKQAAIHKWLEDETYIGSIWEGHAPLERERWNPELQQVYNETLYLSWEKYLEAILSPGTEVSQGASRVHSVRDAYELEATVQKLLMICNTSDLAGLLDLLYADKPHHASHKKRPIPVSIPASQSAEITLLKRTLDQYLHPISLNDDKLLLIDLCRLLIDPSRLEESFLPQIGPLSLSHYYALGQSVAILKEFVRKEAKELFHKHHFQRYRATQFKEDLKKKRQEERALKKYAKPYTDYLELWEKEQFSQFWAEHAITLLSAYCSSSALPIELQEYQIPQNSDSKEPHRRAINNLLTLLSPADQIKWLSSFRSFDSLLDPLYGHYRSLRQSKGVQLQKHLAAAFYPLSGYGYGRSQAYRQSTPAGSVFKMVIAYQALIEKYHALKEWQRDIASLNPLTIIDQLTYHAKPNSPRQILGYNMDNTPIFRSYKGGFLPRSSHPNIGKIDLMGAVEQSSNVYFALLCADLCTDPNTLLDVTRAFGFGEKTGIELPGEIKGELPKDLSDNKTGLYSFSMGQHSLVVTPLQTALMLNAIANKGHIFTPKIAHMIAGHEPLREYDYPFAQQHYPFEAPLAAVGIDFPLFSSVTTVSRDPYIWYHTPEERQPLFIPEVVRSFLIQGMHRVLTGTKGTARPGIIRTLGANPQWAKRYRELIPRLVGKTGTAEILYKQTLDRESKAKIQNHIWFGGTCFEEETKQTWEYPELTVVVYLRHSRAGGKEATPLATEIMKRYEEILARHQEKNNPQ